ncbi:uncharacterized protein MELLADRAFT_94693 [Melampsora larici-populina 98AG31]|uniref:Putative lipoate-protein ligase A n=1 Tax=Melampsora larici-populina (strain 98AG31 / pathotype 3-4-7) TaxID=747676 RepID=F4S7M0_MELLP|nr:uncharacterized protein MELLADRAFT_94693 [Melampsora larici-populina 98AG31]EGF99344.1 hypothetical protein MELLADRAFT_94693 [Melampsora larici-populina 98AG31]
MIYRNTKSVIIGRNQNPWTEANLVSLKKNDVPILRRRSGGGTVYHDEGNTNYSIMIPRGMFDRKTTGELVTRSLISLGLPDIGLNHRHDICLGSDKVSGSAYKLTRDRSYHHGTMLINSNLSQLKDFLNPNQSQIVSRATDSVRSPVTNLASRFSNLDHTSFTNSLTRTFLETYYPTLDPDLSPVVINSEELEQDSAIEDEMKELQSWDWTFGQTPEFSNTIPVQLFGSRLDIHLNIRQGKIHNVELISSSVSDRFDQQEITDQLQSILVGQKYGQLELPNDVESEVIKQIVDAVAQQI